MKNLHLLASRTTHLPRDEGRIWTTPQDSDDGSFIFPRQYPLTFREGSTINVSWATTFPGVNLYFYQRGKVAGSVQLATNLAVRWFQWEVKAVETNLTNPFVYRIVNAQGTTEEQSGGGFWSASWYLSRDESVSSSGSPSSSPLSFSSSTTSIKISSGSKEMSSTSSLPTNTSTSLAPIAPTTQSTQTPLPQKTNDESLSKGAIVGVVVGLIVVGAIIIACIILFLRNRRKKAQANSQAPRYDSIETHKASPNTHKEISELHEAYAQPPELPGVQAPEYYELPGTKHSPPLQ